MTAAFTAACVQLTSGPEPAENLAAASLLIREAHAAGAEFVLTPETTDMMEPRRPLAFEKARDESDHAGLAGFRALAAELSIWLMPGSMVVRETEDRLSNRSFLIGPTGEIVARYDKIHMFDVSIPDGQSYRESSAYRPGGDAVLADLPWGRLGLSVCYDLRFPHLYRTLAKAGAQFLSIPAAFTRFTGEAHWEVLIRARAIETGCFVFAPAQCGEHEGGRETFGHSMIVAPWGEILADGGERPGVIMARIEPEEIGKARTMVPALEHDRPFGVVAPQAPLREAGE